MPEGDLVEVKFRLSDGSDVGPLRFSTASTIAMLKYRIVAELPKDGLFLIEIDRLLKPGGYFVLTSPTTQQQQSRTTSAKKGSSPLEKLTKKFCWSLLAQQDETFIWQKTADSECYASRQDEIPVCKGNDIQMYYQSLASCISGTTSQRWVPIHSKSDSLNSTELEIHGIQPDDFFEDSDFWKLALRNYWSLLSPLIFSDHPKRPGDDDPLPPYNMVRNVMDMNAHYGGLSAALMKEGKSVWVMNVVSLGMRNTLPQKYELFRAKLDAAEQRLTRNW
ncbi:hypothetical protein P3S68_021939 [Capsicum galapagoense]